MAALCRDQDASTELFEVVILDANARDKAMGDLLQRLASPNFAQMDVNKAEVANPTGRHELAPIGRTSFVGFVDLSGGSSDSMTLAIAHRDEAGRAVLNAVRERRPPFSPEAVVGEFSELLKTYGIRHVEGDRYTGEWPRERSQLHGIEYICAEKPKSDIYRALLPVLNSGRAELLDVPKLATCFSAWSAGQAGEAATPSTTHPAVTMTWRMP